MKKDRRFLYIAVLAVIVALLWAGVSAVGRLRKSTIPEDIEKVAAPLDPNLDRSIFQTLSSRK